MVLISVHGRGTGKHGRGLVTAAALGRALEAPGEYVEVDVRVTRDGVLVLCHDPHLVVGGRRYPVADHTWAELRKLQPELTAYADALHAVAATGKSLHLDLKSPPGAVGAAIRAAEAAEDVLPGRVLVTSDQDDLVAALAGWRSGADARLRLALTVGGRRPGRTGWRRGWDQGAQFFPARRWDHRRWEHLRWGHAGADALAVHWFAAWTLVGRWAARRGVPLVVWTVDRPAMLRHFLRPGRAWMVVTNRPGLAARLRGDLTC